MEAEILKHTTLQPATCSPPNTEESAATSSNPTSPAYLQPPQPIATQAKWKDMSQTWEVRLGACAIEVVVSCLPTVYPTPFCTYNLNYFSLLPYPHMFIHLADTHTIKRPTPPTGQLLAGSKH